MESYSPGTADGTESDEEDSAMNDNSEGSDCLESIPVVCKLEPPDDEPPEEPECLETIPVVCKLETAEDDDVTTEDVDLMESMPVVCKLDDPEEGGSGTCLDEEALQDSSVQDEHQSGRVYHGEEFQVGVEGDYVERYMVGEEDEGGLMEIHIKCRICGFMANGTEELHDHTGRVHGGKRVICDICGANLAANSLKRHKSSVHDTGATYTCDICRFTTRSRGVLMNHIRVVHRGPYKCDQCDYGGADREMLNNHLRTHEGVKPFKCHLCDYASTTKGSLMSHINTKHKGIRVFCQMCNKSYGNKGDLRKHVRSVHEKDFCFKCHLCEYKTAFRVSLRLHVEGRHEGKKPFACTYCSYRAALKKNLRDHIERRHMVKDSKVTYPCELCTYVATSVRSMKRHFKLKHATSPKKCEACDKTFLTDIGCRKHYSSVHTNVTYHDCQYCDLKFTLKGTLNEHIKKVHGRKFCDKSKFDIVNPFSSSEIQAWS